MGFKEFVALIAAMMAVNALAIDTMLPALPQMGQAMGVASANERQWIISAYTLGFGVAQIFYGTLTDRFGRKPVLLGGLGIYVLCSTLVAFSRSFELVLLARVLQGIGAASTRILAVSIVRDCYAGRLMAQVMSLSLIVFMMVPVLAPSIGQLILLAAPWPWIFAGLSGFGVAVMLWVVLRLPETLHAADRAPLEFFKVVAIFKMILQCRLAVCYTLAMTFIFGGLFGFINSVQQLFTTVFNAPHMFPVVFAVIAMFIAIASLLNARLVERLGMRKLSHTALLGFITLAFIHALVAISGYETIYSFVLLQSGVMFCFGLMAGNFGAISMEPLGHVAGTAASVQGFISTVGGALLGAVIGQSFNGTDVPLTLGFACCSIAALLIVLVAEDGRLFRVGQMIS